MELKQKAQAKKARPLYDAALRDAHREAKATLWCAVLTMVFFWTVLFLFRDSPETVFSFPLWFAASCIGGYIFSVVAVWVLVTRFFSDTPLDEAAEECRRDFEKDAGRAGEAK
ncbi:MAG: hypothetical protein ACFWTZ_06705 [Burkholderia sp.]|jgi:uncharacterized membrane protein YhdT